MAESSVSEDRKLWFPVQSTESNWQNHVYGQSYDRITHGELSFKLLDIRSFDKELHMSLVTRKPVFGVRDQLRLKPACWAGETSKGIEISAI